MHYDPFDYRIQEDPYPAYRALREHSPAYFIEKYDAWFVSRYDDIQSILRNFKNCSNKDAAQLETIKELLPFMQAKDPPDHTRMRRIVSAMFTPDAVAPLARSVRDLADELLAPHRSVGRIDIIADFAARLPMAIICRLLGFPKEDEDRLRHLTDTVLHREDGLFEMPEAGAQATRDLVAYFETFMAERNRSDIAYGDITGLLMAAEREGAMSHAEVIGNLFQLSIAGNETTTKLIGNMIYQLNAHPDQRRWLVADPSLIPSAVEETLRYDGPTHLQARTLVGTIEMHGERFEAGQKVGMLFISGNRDDRHFHDAETYDIRRNPRNHLAFGGGLHACVGAALARLEAKVAFEALIEIMPDFTVDKTGIGRNRSPAVRGFTTLPVEFTPVS